MKYRESELLKGRSFLAGFARDLGQITDPRISRHKLYPLSEIVFVLFWGSICGAESWRDFVNLGKEKRDFLREFFPFAAGIPCKNTFARVSASINPNEFRGCFISWVNSLQEVVDEGIAIDGKTLRNSAEDTTTAIHMVSAYATQARFVLAQEKVAEKSNEITAIPALLKLIDITGHIVTTDAMGCQREMARQIHDQGGEYVLALKGNPGTLNDDVRLFLATASAQSAGGRISDSYTDVDCGHGRTETRRCVVTDQIDWLEQKSAWTGLKSLVMLEETCERQGKVSTERRFFISSLPADAKKIANAVRSHWMIENSLHWTTRCRV